MVKKDIVIFSFFSGCGILDLGFEEAGFEIVFVNESYKPFLDAYKYSRRHMQIMAPRHGYHNCDIADFLGDKKEELAQAVLDERTNGKTVGFIGGPPCPDFSVGGKNKGKDGANGKLSATYVELIKLMEPDFFLFENVKGLWRTNTHREFYESLKRKLHKKGYATTDRLTNSLEFGAPQDRDRILLFGMNKGNLKTRKNKIENFPWESNLLFSLEDIKCKKWPSEQPFEQNSKRRCPNKIIKELTVEYWFRKNQVDKHPNTTHHFIPRQGIQRMQTVAEGDVSKKSYKRLHRWRYSPTVAYGNNEVHLHPYKERRLSVAEAMALQSLPKCFELPSSMSLSDMFKTIGNGVPLLLANGIAKDIKEYLGELAWEK